MKLFTRSAAAYLILAGVAPSATPSSAQAPARDTARETRWAEDIRFLLDELEVRHANLYHTVPKAELARSADELRKRLPLLDDTQVRLEISRLLAKVGDGHTGYFPPWDRAARFHKYPIELWLTREGPIVLGALPEHAELVGSRVTRIGNVEAAKAVEAVRPLASGDNAFGPETLIAAYLVIPEVLHALGLADDMESLAVETVLRKGRPVRTVLHPLAGDAEPHLVFGAPGGSPPTWIRRRADPYWFELSDGILHLQYNDASVDKKDEPFAAFCDRFEHAARDPAIQRVVVDLRWNDGGSIRRARALVHALIRLRLPEGRLFVAAGRHTFSAAEILAVEVERNTAALFVGEPTGGKPNAYGELTRLKLPNSGLEVRYSALFYQPSEPYDNRPALFPDLQAELTAQDHRPGLDPILRAVRAYRPRTSIRRHLRQRLSEESVEKALEEYDRLRREEFNAYVFDEDELDTLGRELLEESRVAEALAVLRRNAATFPWWGRARFRLGDALARAGQCEEARRSYAAAFSRDRSFPPPRERLARLGLCGGS